MTVPVCPHCGYDIEVDVPILVNDFAMNGAGYPLLYKGSKIPLTRGESLVCWALMKAYPEAVSISALLGRITDDVDNDNLIRVHVTRIRKKLRKVGAPQSIQTFFLAYRWDPLA